MINTNSLKCSGCSSCVAICPKQAIRMKENEKGFQYPVVSNEGCINCSLCDSVCQCNGIEESNNNLRAFYAVNMDKEYLQNSQSGGLFSAIAMTIIKNGGICYGATVERDLVVREKRIDNIEGIKLLQGSKYVQCEVGDSFLDVEEDLRKGRKVLYSGTSCTIYGLLKFLEKKSIDVSNLITCDLICYGVPSPKLYLQNITRLEKEYNEKVVSVNFRNKKKYGWHKCIETYEFSSGDEIDQNYYAELFYSNFALRESCYNCMFLDLNKKLADITMGDFWGIEKFFSKFEGNDEGCSLAIVRSDKAYNLLIDSNLELGEVPVEEVLTNNKGYSTQKPRLYNKFWKDYKKRGFEYILRKYTIYGGKVFRIKRKILKIIKIWQRSDEQ